MEFLEIKNKIYGENLRVAKRLLKELIFDELKSKYGDLVELTIDGTNIYYKNFWLAGLEKFKNYADHTCYKLVSTYYNFNNKVIDKIGAGIIHIDRYEKRVFNQNDMFSYHFKNGTVGERIELKSKRLARYEGLKKDLAYFKRQYNEMTKEIDRLTERKLSYLDNYNKTLAKIKERN